MKWNVEHFLANLRTRTEQNTTDLTNLQDKSIAEGFIPDHRKMEVLKAELFRKVRVGEPTQEVSEAIDVLLEIQKQEDKYRNSFSGQIDSLFALAFWLGITIIPLSFVLTWTCGSSRSPFCHGV